MKNLFLAFCIICLCGCARDEYICIESVSDGFVLTEELAISATIEALKRKGVPIVNVVPVPYWSGDSRIFARNDIDKNSGYVLWHNKNIHTSLYEYSVKIERKGNSFFCRVTYVN